MKNFISKHATQAAYTAAESSFDLPHVAYIEENSSVSYSPYVATSSHDYIEIAGIKWATMNVGAESITDIGLYFQWGDTQGYTASQVGSGSGQKYFGLEDYKFKPSEGYNMTKYNSTDGKTVLDAEDDAVIASWGGSWRMPTNNEINLLISNTTFIWTTNYENSGVEGAVLTYKSDQTKKLFFPLAGYAYNGSIYTDGPDGMCTYCWGNSCFTMNTNMAYTIFSFSNEGISNSTSDRTRGFSVRGVLDD